MANDELWTSESRDQNPFREQRMSPIRISFLFACGAIALSMMATPIIAERTLVAKSEYGVDAYDTIITGSVAPVSIEPASSNAYPVAKRRFTIRRTITENGSVSCVIIDRYNQFSDC